MIKGIRIWIKEEKEKKENNNYSIKITNNSII
jgi:hypothetical protein